MLLGEESWSWMAGLGWCGNRKVVVEVAQERERARRGRKERETWKGCKMSRHLGSLPVETSRLVGSVRLKLTVGGGRTSCGG